MTLTLPIGRLALSVELKVRRNARRVARSGVNSHGDSKRESHRPVRFTGHRQSTNVDLMRAEAFVQLVNHRLV